MIYSNWRRHGHRFDLGRMSVGRLVAAYASHPAVHLYVVGALVSGALAVMLDHGSWRPAVAVLATVAAYPMVWYLIHRFVLHSRLLYRSRLTAALWKRIHFDHHQDPHRMDVLFGSPLNTLPTLLAILLPLGWLIGGQGAAGAAASAAVCAGLVITCVYEFCHCVQHLNVRPRSRLLARMKDLHLAHHFHDEHGNFGITSFGVDRLFGTYYGRAAERARSPHAFNLGYDTDEAARFPWVASLSGGPPRARPLRSKPAEAGSVASQPVGSQPASAR